MEQTQRVTSAPRSPETSGGSAARAQRGRVRPDPESSSAAHALTILAVDGFELHALRYEPDEDDLLATERKVEAVWAAIRLAQETGDWQPNPSRLCDWCSYHQFCPTKGGTVPPLPERVVAPDASTDESDD